MTLRQLIELLNGFEDQDLPVAIIDDGMMELVTDATVETELWDATPEKPILIIW